MRIYNTIEELKRDLNLTKPSVHPGYHIFKHNELSETKKEALDPHKKNFFSIELIADQAWSMKIGHTSIYDMRNSIVFNSPYQLFSVDKYSSDSLTKGITVFFTEQFFNAQEHQFQIQKEFPFFKLNSDPLYKLDKTQQQKIIEIMELMYNESLHPDARTADISRAYLIILLNTIKRVINTNATVVKMTRCDEITCKFEELILAESSNLKTISDFAEKLNITPSYLSECAKKSTGLPAKRILANYTLLRAKSLIKQTNKSIDEISLEMGFSETTNFIKFFKNMENLTPNSYRKQSE